MICLFEAFRLSKTLIAKGLIVRGNNCLGGFELSSLICDTLNLVILKLLWDRGLRIKRLLAIDNMLLLDWLQAIIDLSSC